MYRGGEEAEEGGEGRREGSCWGEEDRVETGQGPLRSRLATDPFDIA
jgi:hypothetical protein